MTTFQAEIYTSDYTGTMRIGFYTEHDAGAYCKRRSYPDSMDFIAPGVPLGTTYRPIVTTGLRDVWVIVASGFLVLGGNVIGEATVTKVDGDYDLDLRIYPQHGS
jgi:hypothetical protein